MSRRKCRPPENCLFLFSSAHHDNVNFLAVHGTSCGAAHTGVLSFSLSDLSIFQAGSPAKHIILRHAHQPELDCCQLELYRMAASDAFTPLKIRGKRRGIPAEKWNAGRSRAAGLQKRPEPSLTSASSDPPAAKSLRARRAQDESPLEQLPAEILQEIFEYAGNVDLPVVSRQLAAKLSQSHHLQSELATHLLEPVLDSQVDAKLSSKELRAATRLLNSRFVTWQFFTAWLTRRHDIDPELGSPDWQKLWAALRPSHALLPPRKLLSPPFSPEKVAFLSTLAQNINDIAALDSSCSEDVYEGLIAAIHAGQAEVVGLFLGMGLNSDTELLRVAVVDADCNKNIVEMLVDAAMATRPSNGRSIDLLDPSIWSWAEQARERDNDRGVWLISYLQELQRKNVPFQ